MTLLQPALLTAEDLLVLKSTGQTYFLNQGNIQVFEDPDQKFTIDQVASASFRERFHSLSTEFPENSHSNSAYWIKFTVVDSNPDTHWVLESYNFKLRNIELFVPDGNRFEAKRSGSALPFHYRVFNHKNFEFQLPEKRYHPITYYIRYVSHYSSRVRLVIRSEVAFASYALNEYFILGIFYGMIVIMGLYNLILYARLKDIAYLYYSFYVFFVGLFSMVQDGTGFQYLWPSLPGWNTYSLFFYSTFMVLFLLLYTSSFLETKVRYPKLHRILLATIAMRLILCLLESVFIDDFIHMMWLDLIPFGLAYIIAIVSYRDNNRCAIYFITGFSVLFLGNLVNILRLYKILPANILTVYILNISAIIEMILLSQALAERVEEIKESELVKERMNKELEQKVKERTEALVIQKNIIEEKAKTLDNFIYKTAHDIKGPLKSLIGITSLGKKDVPENSQVYFEHALKTAKKLDAIVKDLLEISRINNLNPQLSEIDFQIVIEEVLSKFKRLPGYDKIKFDVTVNSSCKFYSEKSILSSVFQNIVENAIKFRNKKSRDNELLIIVNCNYNICEIKFKDNGIGIPEEYQEKVFDMFFRIDNSQEDSSGLGLYLVKLSVEKLGGQIYLQSALGKGSTFTLFFKNLPSLA